MSAQPLWTGELRKPGWSEVPEAWSQAASFLAQREGTGSTLVLPGWLLMRFAGDWIDSKENVPGDPAWLGIGSLVGDAGLLLLVVTALLAWWGLRRPQRGWPVKAVAVVASVYLIALFVAVWVMTAKPD